MFYKSSFLYCPPQILQAFQLHWPKFVFVLYWFLLKPSSSVQLFAVFNCPILLIESLTSDLHKETYILCCLLSTNLTFVKKNEHVELKKNKTDINWKSYGSFEQISNIFNRRQITDSRKRPTGKKRAREFVELFCRRFGRLRHERVRQLCLVFPCLKKNEFCSFLRFVWHLSLTC